ncbi:MAG: hypothetical protein QOJ72_2338 [Nocardioidaceae bacterium]|jgi:uncharacterized protein with FMN-binding domain|nr:hypothetical protein [Nocardioidaceae bacterium]
MKLSPTHKFFSATAAVSVLLLTAACGGNSSDGASSDPTTSATSDSSGSSDDSSSSSDASFKDGTYSGEASYVNPGGNSKLKVDLTLADDKITKIKVTPEATDPTSKGHQTDFAGGIAAETVGKRIDQLHVTTVAGSSLTHLGFDKAIKQIESEAKA